MGMSEHTRLVNMVMGLCQDTLRWPGILHDLGYAIQLIEQTISLRESTQKVAPDVVAVSNRLVHAMVIDCKSGANIDPDQDNRYGLLEPPDLAYHITVHDPSRLTHAVCYADGLANHKFLEPHTKLPFITFGPDAVGGSGDFGKEQVNDRLCKPVSLEGMREPTGFYPFSPDDEDSEIIPHILPGLLSCMVQRGGEAPSVVDSAMAEAVLKRIHPFHEQISSRHKKRLIARIMQTINVCKDSDAEFRQQLAKIAEGKANHNTMQSLQRICEGLIGRYAHQKSIDNFCSP